MRSGEGCPIRRARWDSEPGAAAPCPHCILMTPIRCILVCIWEDRGGVSIAWMRLQDAPLPALPAHGMRGGLPGSACSSASSAGQCAARPSRDVDVAQARPRLVQAADHAHRLLAPLLRLAAAAAGHTGAGIQALLSHSLSAGWLPSGAGTSC